jgi:hypothetical protein
MTLNFELFQIFILFNKIMTTIVEDAPVVLAKEVCRFYSNHMIDFFVFACRKISVEIFIKIMFYHRNMNHWIAMIYIRNIRFELNNTNELMSNVF